MFGYRVMDFNSFKRISDINWFKVISTTGMVFISYGGITKIASIAEEVKNPQKNLIRGALSAFLVVQIIYLVVIFVILGILSDKTLSNSLKPVSDAAYKIAPGQPLGNILLFATSIGALPGLCAAST